MRLCFDLDQTLCHGYPYEYAQPYPGVASLLSKLRALGHTIIIFTARGMGRSNGNLGLAQRACAQITLNQLEQWGFEYDEIYFGKPSADMYIDDKAMHSSIIDKLIGGGGLDEHKQPRCSDGRDAIKSFFHGRKD